MTTNMISAARLIAHKTVNGRYQSRLQMDQFPVLGHQMTVSCDFDENLQPLLNGPSIRSTRSLQTVQIPLPPSIVDTSQL